MEFENLKSVWKEAKEEHLPEVSLDEQKQINTPLDMIKLNMRTEFWLMIILLALSIVYGFLAKSNTKEGVFTNVVSIFSVAIIIYFYARLRLFYGKINAVTPNTNYSLLNLKTELMVTKEIFLSYYVLYIPLNLLAIVTLAQSGKESEIGYFLHLISFLICVILVLLVRRYWLYYMYGKYIDKIVALVDELNGLETSYKEVKVSRFERSQMYFVKKWGLLGNMINIVLWLSIWFVVFWIVMTIVAFVVLKVGAQLHLIDLNQLQKELTNFSNNY